MDARLPDGGGNTIDGFLDRNPNTATLAPNNFFTLARDYGDQIQQWNGVDLTMNARIRPDLYVQGGMSTGRTLTDNCDILAKLPESNPLGVPYCRQLTNFLTQYKFLGSYTVPKIVVQLSGAFQSIPGPNLAANRVVVPAQTTLGRPFTNAANLTLNLVEPGIDVWRAAQPARFPHRQAVPVRGPDADVGELRPLQRVQRQHRAGRERHLCRRRPSTSGACRRRS